MKFSVVIPTYNAKEYIQIALDTLLQQSYGDFEVIVVDDASTDQTAQLLIEASRNFAEQGIEFSYVLLEQNQGPSHARNQGLSKAKGEYVLFWDADDFYEITALEQIANQLKQHPVDYLIYGYTEDYEKQKGELAYQIAKTYESVVLTQDSPKSDWATVLRSLEQSTMLGYPWNKAFRREFLIDTNILFQKIPHIEDILFNLEVVKKADSMVVMPQLLYHYRNQGQARLTSRYLPDYFSLQKKRIAEFLQVMEKWENPITKETYQVAANFYFRGFQSHLVREYGHGTKTKEILAMGKQEMSDSLYLTLQPFLKPEGKLAKWLYQALGEGNIAVALRRGKVIYLAQNKFPHFYARLKQSR